MNTERSKDAAIKVSLASEELAVTKRLVDGDTLRVTVQTKVDDRPVTLTNVREEISIETVEINREITSIPEIRTEGDVTIIPVVEEEEVVIKRLFLKQEVKITKSRIEEISTDTVQLRSEHAVIERSLSPDIQLENIDD